MARTSATRQVSAVTRAIARGRARASEIADLRATRLRRRARATSARPARRRAPVASRIPARTTKALGASAATGLLVAEGDSWFDYPLNDVLGILEDDYGYDVESVAHKGDCVEDMAYAGGQFEEFARRLEKLLRQGRVPDAILLSGGGNDIAGDEFAILLNHAASGLPPLNADVVRGVIDVRLRDAFAFLVSGLTELARRYLDRPIPILVHGYDYPIPDGRGFLGGFGPLPGPWLQPGFHRKGYADRTANMGVLRDLIDPFNAMLEQVTRTTAFGHVHYVDLRRTLASDAGYKKDWANELHPTGRGFEAVTAKIAKALAAL